MVVRPCLCYNTEPTCIVFQPPLQELENLRKQAEIIPQLMAECESVTEKLQVGLASSSLSSLRGDLRRERSGREDLRAELTRADAACAVGEGEGGGGQRSHALTLRRT